MKSLIAPLLTAASFLSFTICGFVAASSVNASYHPHDFHNLTAGIWTSAPVRVDQSSQKFQRLPALVPSTAPDLALTVKDPLVDHTVENAAFAETAAAGVSDNSLCQQRYRSYRASDNTYQPYTGGPRRVCELGSKATTATAAQETKVSSAVASSSLSDHQAWCQARYSSYNPLDDSYQPFGGGSRRTCASPNAVAFND
jgi:hypothetical protein